MAHKMQPAQEPGKIPPVAGLLILTAIGISAYIILCIAVGPPWFIQYHFENEFGAVTVLSAILMGIGGGFAGMAFFLQEKKGSFKGLFWLLASIVLLFFAIDELLGFHEQWGDYLGNSVGLSTGNFRNWNDIIVILYGLMAVCCIPVFFKVIRQYPRFLELLILAFIFYAAHTFIDSVSEPKTVASVIYEESAKLFCSAFLSLSMFTGLLGSIYLENRGECRKSL